MRRILPAVLCTCLLNGIGAVESDLSLLDLPQPVKASILREAKGQGVGAIEREVVDGRIRYHVRIEQEGIDKRVTLANDGQVVASSDYAEVNNALATGKQAGRDAWDKTKEVSTQAWEATKETVGKATSSFKSDELTLNQVPVVPRTTLEREAGAHRLADIRARTTGAVIVYSATITSPDGSKRTIAVRDDGTLLPP